MKLFGRNFYIKVKLSYCTVYHLYLSREENPWVLSIEVPKGPSPTFYIDVCISREETGEIWKAYKLSITDETS